MNLAWYRVYASRAAHQMKTNHHESVRSSPLNTALVQRYALILINECSGGSAAILRWRIKLASSNEDLRKLRSALFDCMSLQLGEVEAMERIRSFDLSA